MKILFPTMMPTSSLINEAVMKQSLSPSLPHIKRRHKLKGHTVPTARQKKRTQSKTPNLQVLFFTVFNKWKGKKQYAPGMSDQERRGRWIAACRPESVNVTRHTRVCSKHMKPIANCMRYWDWRKEQDTSRNISGKTIVINNLHWSVTFSWKKYIQFCFLLPCHQ